MTKRKAGKQRKNKQTCPITSDPQRRVDSEKQSESIRLHFPKGLARPALRALFAAGLKKLEDLTSISEAELLTLHGIGPNAFKILKTALTNRGLHFRDS